MNTTRRLKALMKLHNVTHTHLADKLGVSLPTLRSRFNEGHWDWHEVVVLMDVLEINNPKDIFFKFDVSSDETREGVTA